MEDDVEIEYLDEDENLVQEYVQTVQKFPPPVLENIPSIDDDQIELLVVQKNTNEPKRKHKIDKDSDYVPEEETEEEAKPKRRRYPAKKTKPLDTPKRRNPSQKTETLLNNTVIKPLDKIGEHSDNVPGEEDRPKRRRAPAKCIIKSQCLLDNKALKPFIKPPHKPVYSTKSYEEKLKNLPNLVVKKQLTGQCTEKRLSVKDNRSSKTMKKADPSLIEKRSSRTLKNLVEPSVVEKNTTVFKNLPNLVVKKQVNSQSTEKRLSIKNNVSSKTLKKAHPSLVKKRKIDVKNWLSKLSGVVVVKQESVFIN